MRRGLLVPLVIVMAALVLAAIVIARGSGDVRPDRATPRSGYAWTQVRTRPPLKRTEVAGAALGNDLYVLGGFLRSHRTTAAVERFRGGEWRRVRSLPVALNHAAAVGYRGHVYVVGGYAGRDSLIEPQKTLYRYDPKRNRWARLSDMPTARAALATGAVDGRLYAAGGAAGGKQTAVVEIYDIATRRWSRGPSLSVAREHLGGTVGRGRFFAVAGRNNNGNLAIVEDYDPVNRRWSRLPDMPKARGGNGAVPLGDGIVAVGGEEGAGTIAEVDRFDLATRKWQRLDPMPTPRHGLAVVTDNRGAVWTISGGPQPGFAFSNAVEVLRSTR
jgi:Kelch motif/Galactose oxidase, central domain